MKETNGDSLFRKKILYAILTIIFSFSVISIVGINIVFHIFFPRFDKKEYSNHLTYHAVKAKYDRIVVDFKSNQNTLKGYLYGEDNSKGLVVIAHGLGGGAESYLAETLYFVDHGWRVFSYDCTGSYESEGNGTIGLPQAVIDLKAALTYINHNPSLNHLPLLLYGHSWGGYAVTSILNYEEYDITAVVSVSGFNSPMEVMIEKAEAYIGPIALLEYPFVWSYQSLLFGETAYVTAVEGINNTDIPVMIIHGDKDKSISYQGSGIIAHSREITNPNVIYKTCSNENRNDHKNLLLSEEAYLYRKEIKEKFKTLSDQYDSDIPDEIRAGYYKNINILKASELDLTSMKEIHLFFESSLKKQIVKHTK